MKIIKQAGVEAVRASVPADLLFGTVQSESPLQIFINQKIILSGDEIILSRNVTDYETELSFDDPDIKQIYTTWNMAETEESQQQKIAFKAKINHKVTIYNGLKAGERVAVLRLQGGQKFFVIDRVVVA